MSTKKTCLFLVSIALLVLSCFPQSALVQSERVQITILGTTDLHGNINPIDYYTNKPDNRGLAKIATLIKAIRKDQPNVLLIDSGDTIQGIAARVVSRPQEQSALPIR
jgi:2',3'-cyclic-nucleotide 2'-phosphodiesterase/3'-nucleotidase